MGTHDVGDVVAYGFLTDEELPSYFFGSFILYEQFENFPLPIRQQGFAFLISQLVATLPCSSTNNTRVRDSVKV